MPLLHLAAIFLLTPSNNYCNDTKLYKKLKLGKKSGQLNLGSLLYIIMLGGGGGKKELTQFEEDE